MTSIPRTVIAGDQRGPQVAERMLPLVYDELRRLATRRLSREKPGQTLQATALVHEVYLRLANGDPNRCWEGRIHFFAAAAESMRRILVENARSKARKKRGGGWLRVDLADQAAPIRHDDLLALDDALIQLMSEDPVAVKVVELRQFAGLGHEEVASVLGITVYLARHKWAYARAWLREALSA